MKKLSILIVLASVSFAAYSQNNNDIKPPEPIDQSKFSVGLKGGFGHSFITPYSNPVFSPSWDAGISVVYAPGKHWGIELDAIYCEEGAKFEYTNSEQRVGTRVVFLDYIRIPLKAVYFFRSYENDFRPKITLGPTLGILMTEINSRNAEPIDFGANATVGFNYRVARAVWLTVDAGYYHGLMDVYPGGDGNMNGNARLDIGMNFGF